MQLFVLIGVDHCRVDSYIYVQHDPRLFVALKHIEFSPLLCFNELWWLIRITIFLKSVVETFQMYTGDK